MNTCPDNKCSTNSVVNTYKRHSRSVDVRIDTIKYNLASYQDILPDFYKEARLASGFNLSTMALIDNRSMVSDG